MVISENVARTFFGHADPIGRFLSLVPSETGGPQPHATIVGVAAEALLTRVDGQTFGEIYHPISRERSNPPSLLVRTTTPGRTAREVEAALRGVDPRVRPTTSLVQRGLDDYLGFRRRMVWVLGPPAVLALLLAALGVYGMMAFVVSLRTSEISVRMALGASAADVLRLLVRDGMRPVVVGLAVGLGFGLAAGRVFAQELPGISPSDPTAVGAALAILLTFALLAVVVPAVRAARMDPAVVLREG
jgi:putative ABC transport system permease protein